MLLIVLFLPSGGAEYGRVLVVAIDGAALAEIDALVARGQLPTLGASRSGGVSVSLSGGSSHLPLDYWRRVLAEPSDVGAPVAVSLWSDLETAGRRVVAVNVPVALLEPDRLTHGLPGADEAAGFIGDSTGRVVTESLLSRGRVEWPYRAASSGIVNAAGSLEIGLASEWLEVRQPQPDSRTGWFRIYRLDDETYYLTPVYRRTFELPQNTVLPADDSAGGASQRFVADDASYAASSSRLVDYLLPHAADVSRDRAEAARRLSTEPWEFMFYFESLIATARGVHAGLLSANEGGGVATVTDLAEQYRQVDEQIGRMLEAAGPGTLLVVLTREPEMEPAEGSHSGSMLIGSGGTAASAEGLESAVAPTLLALASVDKRPASASKPLYSVSARYRSTHLAVTVQRDETSHPRAFAGTAETLERLGGLADSVSIPATGDGDAQYLP